MEQSLLAQDPEGEGPRDDAVRPYEDLPLSHVFFLLGRVEAMDFPQPREHGEVIKVRAAHVVLPGGHGIILEEQGERAKSNRRGIGGESVGGARFRP